MWIPRKPYGFQFIYIRHRYYNKTLQMQWMHLFVVRAISLSGNALDNVLSLFHSFSFNFSSNISSFLALLFIANYILFAHMQLSIQFAFFLSLAFHSPWIERIKAGIIRAKLFNSWWLCAVFLLHNFSFCWHEIRLKEKAIQFLWQPMRGHEIDIFML